MTCRLRHLSIRNPNGGTTRTFTVEDGSGNLLYTGTLAANGIWEVDLPRPGKYCSGGIQWQTSGGTDLIGDMLLDHHPGDIEQPQPPSPIETHQHHCAVPELAAPDPWEFACLWGYRLGVLVLLFWIAVGVWRLAKVQEQPRGRAQQRSQAELYFFHRNSPGTSAHFSQWSSLRISRSNSDMALFASSSAFLPVSARRVASSSALPSAGEGDDLRMPAASHCASSPYFHSMAAWYARICARMTRFCCSMVI